jgi:hypothetical protein
MSESAKLDAKHLDVLLRHKHHYDLFIRTGELINFTQDVQNELLDVMRVREPYYTYNNRCGACVGSFLVTIYKTFANDIYTFYGNSGQ